MDSYNVKTAKNFCLLTKTFKMEFIINIKLNSKSIT